MLKCVLCFLLFYSLALAQKLLRFQDREFYLFNKQRTYWREAVRTCESVNGFLVSITTRAVFDFLVNEIRKEPLPKAQWEQYTIYYTSGRRITQTSSGLDYQWTYPSSPRLLQVPPTYWLPGEPTPSLTEKDACLELRVSDVEAGITTSPCNTSKFVICDNSNKKFNATPTVLYVWNPTIPPGFTTPLSSTEGSNTGILDNINVPDLSSKSKLIIAIGAVAGLLLLLLLCCGIYALFYRRKIKKHKHILRHAMPYPHLPHDEHFVSLSEEDYPPRKSLPGHPRHFDVDLERRSIYDNPGRRMSRMSQKGNYDIQDERRPGHFDPYDRDYEPKPRRRSVYYEALDFDEPPPFNKRNESIRESRRDPIYARTPMYDEPLPPLSRRNESVRESRRDPIYERTPMYDDPSPPLSRKNESVRESRRDSMYARTPSFDELPPPFRNRNESMRESRREPSYAQTYRQPNRQSRSKTSGISRS